MGMISNVGSSISFGVCRLYADAWTLGTNITADLKKSSLRDLSGLYYQFDKVTKWSGSALNLFPIAARVSGFVTDSKGLKTALTPITASVLMFKDLCYALLWIKDIDSWMEKDKTTGRINFKMPAWDLRLYTVGNLCEFGVFVHSYIYKFDVCSQIAKGMGTWEILGVKPFTFPVLANCSYNPKDIFIFAACSVRFFPYAGRFARLTFKASPLNSEEKQELKDMLKFDQVLKHVVCSLGKMAIIWVAPNHYMKDWFPLLTLISDSGSLIGGVLKKRRELEVK